MDSTNRSALTNQGQVLGAEANYQNTQAGIAANENNNKTGILGAILPVAGGALGGVGSALGLGGSKGGGGGGGGGSGAITVPSVSDAGFTGLSGSSGGFAKGGLVKMDKGGKVLDANARKHIAPHNYALSDGRYPIHDLVHARNALARVAQNGTPEEKKKVKAKVHEKYPELAGKKMAAGGQVESSPQPFAEAPSDPNGAQSSVGRLLNSSGNSPRNLYSGGLAAKGGDVVANKAGEKATVKGDSLENDKIPAMLSEGEVVLDRATLADKGPIGQMARAVARHIEKRNGKNK